MTDESAQPSPLPPASESPYPVQPAPHGATNDIPVAKKAPPPITGIGPLGVTLIGGAVAATLGLLVAIPFLKRRKPAAKPTRQRASRTRKTD